MPYRVEFRPEAIDDLRRLDKAVAQRILRRIRWLSENVEDIPLEALAGEFTGSFKLRVGSHRVIYFSARSENLIVVQAVGHRRDVYRSR